MILDKNFLKNNLQQVCERNYNYLLLDVEYVQKKENTDKLKYSIETLNILNVVSMANETYKESNSSNRIDTSIFHEIIDSILNDDPLNDIQLIEYYETVKKLDKFYNLIVKWQEIETSLPYKVDFMILGLSFEEQETLCSKEEQELYGKYGQILSNNELQDSNVTNTIENAKCLIADFKERSTKIA